MGFNNYLKKFKIKKFFDVASHYKNVYYWYAISKFLLSNSYGASIEKVYTRYLDLSRIVSILRPNGRILEFGSGFSSIFFSYLPHMSIVSVEEFENYKPKALRKSHEFHCIQTKNFDSGIEKTRLFVDRNFDTEFAYNFIYIDGPQTPIWKNGYTGANIDIQFLSNLTNSIIGVDIRFNTCIYLYHQLEVSHRVLLSKKILNLIRFEKVEHPFREIDLTLEPLGLKLTTLFIPKIYFPVALNELQRCK